ncbi:MAG TPA: aminotransferase class I/II-fold pyridoxal phosphate-dependent enzyme [Candidatus Hydrogenedentes bacterium]|nr:aminotransferase class I/II-fold pyridoxal phosphate-dependent enzyme [Candidatus Hydrogenedentota bacterium]
MHVLVTGGGGYLGTWVVSKLLDRGHIVRVFDRFCFGQEVLAEFNAHPHCEIIAGDIRRLQETPNLLQGIDGVMHLASLSNDPSCELDAEMAMDVNVESTMELAKMAVQHGVRRFVLSSSCTVYGRGVFELLDEESPANPLSTFGKGKLAAERAILQMCGDHFEPAVARMASMFGWSRRMRFDLAINQMVATAMRQGCIEVRGGGNQWRPFVHVRDAARGMIALLESPAEKVSGQIFNVGSDVYNTRVIDLAHRVARHFQGIAVEMAADDDDLRNFRVQFAKIRERLGFYCQWSIDEGIEELRSALEDASIDPFLEKYLNVHRMKQLMATPVDEGGEPVAARFIPLSKPCLGEEEERAVLDAMHSGWLTSGPHIQAFEKAFSDVVTSPLTVGVCSCTAALHLCLMELGVKPGDEVITSPITWASTGNTVINMGAKVKFADIDPNSYNLSPESLESAITDRTKVIMPVHLGGHPCDLDAIHHVARKHGIPVLEDAAHALGAAYKSTTIGAYSDLTCFSFYAIKNITTMEGGAITLKDPEQAERLRLLARNGMVAAAWDRYGRSAVATPQQVIVPGFKYGLNNVGAAMGLEQLKKLPGFLAARRRIAHMYHAVLSEVDEIELPSAAPDVEHAWHLYIIRLKLELLNRTRDEIIYDLRRENIGTSVHFYGLHLHPYYRDALGMKPEDYPEATKASNEILSLPLYPQLTDKNIHEVVAALKKVLAHAAKG